MIEADDNPHTIDTTLRGGVYRPVRLRCSRGHEWEVLYGASDGTVTLGGEVFCYLCLVALARELVGTVTRVE